MAGAGLAFPLILATLWPASARNPSSVMKRILLRVVLPWAITIVALSLAFKGVEWDQLIAHASSADLSKVGLAVALTILSYFIRAIRWPVLFPNPRLDYLTSYRVLVLGFFMNNILPARAGEIVRAHLGGKVTGEPRTLVLATVASERLADGLTISLLFAAIIVVFGRGHLSAEDAQTLMLVAYLFVGAALSVIGVLLFRTRIFALADTLARKLDHKASTYTLNRVQVFINGLSPLCSPRRAIIVAFWSLAVWSIELGVFAAVGNAFEATLPLSSVVLFMVAVNFSSLVPAAAGGFGTIELFAKKVLLSVGVAGDALALSMVLTQHLIQYVVIGIQGVILLMTSKYHLKDMTAPEGEEDDAKQVASRGSAAGA
jgi:uncharacterized protein (TIRG00374 family)